MACGARSAALDRSRFTHTSLPLPSPCFQLTLLVLTPVFTHMSSNVQVRAAAAPDGPRSASGGLGRAGALAPLALPCSAARRRRPLLSPLKDHAPLTLLSRTQQGAIIIVGVMGLLDYPEFIYLWRVSGCNLEHACCWLCCCASLGEGWSQRPPRRPSPLTRARPPPRRTPLLLPPTLNRSTRWTGSSGTWPSSSPSSWCGAREGGCVGGWVLLIHGGSWGALLLTIRLVLEGCVCTA